MKWNTIIALTLCLLAPCIIAARPKAAPSSSITTDMTRLPSGYEGDSIRELYSQYAVASKSESETASEYAARLSRLPARLVAIRYPNIGGSYNDTNGKITLSSPSGTLHVSTRRRDLGSYVGPNKTRIRKKNSTTWDLKLERADGTVIPGIPPMAVTIEKKDARKLIPRIKVLVVCNLGPFSAPIAYEDQKARITSHELIPATISSPYDLELDYKALAARPIAYWIYDAGTGTILKKVDAVN